MQRTASRVTLAFAILTASAAVGAQSPARAPAPPHKLIAFDVASIRLQKEHSGGPIRFTEDGFSADAGPLEYLIRNAYNITRDHSIRGLPAWGAADYYVVSAKVADSDLPEWKTYTIGQRRQVLQQLLADRFHLILHPETVQIPIYSLIVAKGGPKMQQVTPPVPGSRGGIEARSPGVFVGRYVILDRLVTLLSSSAGLDRQVFDNTGLTGNYDFTLTYEPMGHASASLDSASEAQARPSIFTALQEQLGLKLQPTTGPLDTLVIDHVERPSDN
ncbi:MAG TPA: TIGR03435 family protein [Acidobacteriaceae bacterium]|nr:TIGR03435 family protein [Acidobacteriaceae bacterium]